MVNLICMKIFKNTFHNQYSEDAKYGLYYM